MALSEPAKYVSTKSHFRIIIKPRGKMIVNGEVIRVPGKSAQFIDHQYITHDEDIAMTLDSLIDNHPGWRQKFQRVPSSLVMEAARKQREEVIAATRQIQEKYRAERHFDEKKTKEIETFEQFKNRIKMSNPIVTGVRDVSNRNVKNAEKPVKEPIGVMKEKATGEIVADPKDLKRKSYKTEENKDV